VAAVSKHTTCLQASRCQYDVTECSFIYYIFMPLAFVAFLNPVWSCG